MLSYILTALLGAAAGAGLLATAWWLERRRAGRLDQEIERRVLTIDQLRRERDAARRELATLRLRHQDDGGPRTMRPEELARVKPLLDVGGGP